MTFVTEFDIVLLKCQGKKLGVEQVAALRR